MNLVLRRLGILEIDPGHLEEGKVTLAFLGVGPADLPLDRIAGAQRKAANLRGRNINVVRAGEVVGVRRAQEAEAVLQDLDDAGADDLDILGGELLKRRKHELLLAHGAGILDASLLSKA